MSAYPDGAAVSHWERNGEKLLIIYNVNYTPAQVDLPDDMEYYDTLNEEEHPADFELNGRGMRFLLAK